MFESSRSTLTTSSHTDDALDTSFINMSGFDFDYDDDNHQNSDRWQGTLKGLQMTSTNHDELAPGGWIEYANKLPLSRSNKICIILKYIINNINFYILIEASEFIPPTLITDPNANHIISTPLNEEITCLEELITNRSDGADSSQYFMSEELRGKDLVIQLDHSHTTRMSSDALLNTLNAIMTVNVKSFVYHPTSSATADSTITDARPYNTAISALSLSLNRLRYAVGHAATEALIKSTEALADGQENRRRMGPLNETIFHQCLRETDGRG